MSASDSRLAGGNRPTTPTRVLSRRAFGAVIALMIAVIASPALAAKPANKPGKGPNGPTLLPLRITDVVVNEAGDGLTAVGQIGDQVVNLPLALGLSDNQDGAHADCPILDLALGPINLDLLGLNVVTSEICLRITAEPGDGNLLGNLLCGVAGLLDDGVSLGDILDTLDAAELAALTDGLTELLNGALKEITAPTSFAGVGSTTPEAAAAGMCDILSLELGPIDLNLLGLDVELDDCDGGPVTVDIFAEAGRGNLLGNLLCDIAGLLDGGLDLDELDNVLDNKDLRKLLNRVSKAIRQLT